MNQTKKINSRAKGAAGEREWAGELTTAGFKARRGQQFAGGTDSPDVVCPSLPDVHFEVKRVQQGNLYTWLRQAIRDAAGKIPVVAHRRNHCEWVVVLRADDFFDIVRNSDLPHNPETGKPEKIFKVNR